MKLEESLKKKAFVITAEIQPAIGETAGLSRRVDTLKGRVDGLTVPELKIEGLVADTMGTCRLLKAERFDPILQTTCRDKSRIELQDHLVKAAEAGIDNILTFTEDYRISGDSLQEIMFFHVDSGKLFSVVNALRQGTDVAGREIAVRADFCVGSGIDSSSGKKVPDLELKEMESLAVQGAGYFLTTPIFDLDSFHQFMKRVGPLQVPVIAEVMLVRSAEMALFLNKHLKMGMVPNHVIEKLARAVDKEKASLEIVSELVKGLKDLCQGVHLIPIGAEENLHKYLEAARKAAR